MGNAWKRKAWKKARHKRERNRECKRIIKKARRLFLGDQE